MTRSIIPAGIGAISLFVIGKDSLNLIKENQEKETKNNLGKIGADIFLKNSSADSQSQTINNLQKSLKNIYMDENKFTQVVSAKNLFTSTANVVKDNFVNLALSAGAIGLGLMRNSGAKVGAWACAGLLAVQGISAVTKDVLGFGKKSLF